MTGGREQVAQKAQLTVDDVKGWMTLQQAADGLGIPVATVIGLIDPADGGGLGPSTVFKDVEAKVPGSNSPPFANNCGSTSPAVRLQPQRRGHQRVGGNVAW